MIAITEDNEAELVLFHLGVLGEMRVKHEDSNRNTVTLKRGKWLITATYYYGWEDEADNGYILVAFDTSRIPLRIAVLLAYEMATEGCIVKGCSEQSDVPEPNGVN
jgi:hypothetical protein